MKTSELIGVALDWAVAHAQGAGAALVLTHSHGQALILSDHTDDCDIGEHYQPSINWAQGGPIIERERIGVMPAEMGWQAGKTWEFFESESFAYHREYGDTPLIAAMRCFVASKLGDEIDIDIDIDIGD